MVLSILNTKTKRVGIILAITAAIAWGTYSTFLVLMYDFTAKTPIKSTFSGGKLSLYVELSSIG